MNYADKYGKNGTIAGGVIGLAIDIAAQFRLAAYLTGNAKAVATAALAFFSAHAFLPLLALALGVGAVVAFRQKGLVYKGAAGVLFAGAAANIEKIAGINNDFVQMAPFGSISSLLLPVVKAIAFAGSGMFIGGAIGWALGKRKDRRIARANLAQPVT